MLAAVDFAAQCQNSIIGSRGLCSVSYKHRHVWRLPAGQEAAAQRLEGSSRDQAGGAAYAGSSGQVCAVS